MTMANNQSITISQRKRINNHVDNLIINTINNNNNNTKHISYNTNSNLIGTTTTTNANVNVNNAHEVSLDISNIRKKVDSELNASEISNNFIRNEAESSNADGHQHGDNIQQHVKKISPMIMSTIPTDTYTTKDDEIISSERKDLTTNTYINNNNKQHSKCKGICERICIIRLLFIVVISLSLFLFLKWKLHF
jgi:hypothetical protein